MVSICISTLVYVGQSGIKVFNCSVPYMKTVPNQKFSRLGWNIISYLILLFILQMCWTSAPSFFLVFFSYRSTTYNSSSGSVNSFSLDEMSASSSKLTHHHDCNIEDTVHVPLLESGVIKVCFSRYYHENWWVNCLLSYFQIIYSNEITTELSISAS